MLIKTGKTSKKQNFAKADLSTEFNWQVFSIKKWFEIKL
jgi:hypothetical protein